MPSKPLRVADPRSEKKRDTAQGWWINGQSFHGFRDTQNHPAVPYLFVFQTKAQ